MLVRATALHLVFGTAAGALYGVLSPRRAREVTGIGFAGLIWAAVHFPVGLAETHPPVGALGAVGGMYCWVLPRSVCQSVVE